MFLALLDFYHNASRFRPLDQNALRSDQSALLYIIIIQGFRLIPEAGRLVRWFAIPCPVL